MSEHESTRHDASPEVAIAAVREHQGPLLIDLDETLYMRNSTEDFIDSARPRLLGLLLMRLLDAIKPWRWTGGEVTRDTWRARLVATCFPWTLRHWTTRVPALASAFVNHPLMAELSQPGADPIITTAGFRPIVEPLIAALGLPNVQIVAARLTHFIDRRGGKLQLATAALGLDTIQRALVLTDSTQDLPILEVCARPLRTLWPGARYRPAFSSVYLPGQYLVYVKRPGTRYIVRAILQDDFALWVLSSIALAPVLVTHVLGLFILLVSFWAIYEQGYVDNDWVAERFEEEPKLTAQYADSLVATPRWQPWIWAIALGIVAVFVLRWPSAPTAPSFAAWAAVLLGTHLWFRSYNRLDKPTRVWMFAGLQFARSAAFVVLVPIVPIGAVAIGAHVLAKWVPYFLYRLSGQDWPEAPFHLIRLMFFLILAVLLGVASGFDSLASVSTVLLLAWNLFRARKELILMLSATHRLRSRR